MKIASSLAIVAFLYIAFLPTAAHAIPPTPVLGAISVKDPAFGVLGDGSDETVKIQQALDSGYKMIVFPAGTYGFSRLTIPDWVHLVGQTYQPGVGVESGDVILNSSLTSGFALELGYAPYIENLTIVNGAASYDEKTLALSGSTATAIHPLPTKDPPAGTMTLRNVQFQKWYTAVSLDGTPYYVKTYGVEFNRCVYGYRATNAAPYNLHIDSPISRLTQIFLAGTATSHMNDVKIFGGSIEGFSTVAAYVNHISIFGTYFESQRPDAWAFDSLSSSGSLTLFGCTVYLNNIRRFANASGLENFSLVSMGNSFTSNDNSQDGDIVYYPPNSGNVQLKGDQVLFKQGYQPKIHYVSNVSLALKYDITYPILPTWSDQAVLSGKTIVNSSGIVTSGHSSDPSKSIPLYKGEMVLADGVNWDPLNRRYGRPYWVLWQGDRWMPISG